MYFHPGYFLQCTKKQPSCFTSTRLVLKWSEVPWKWILFTVNPAQSGHGGDGSWALPVCPLWPRRDCHKNGASWRDSRRRCWVDSPTVSWSSPLALPAPFLHRIPTALNEARHIFIFLTAWLRLQPWEMEVCVSRHILPHFCWQDWPRCWCTDHYIIHTGLTFFCCFFRTTDFSAVRGPWSPYIWIWNIKPVYCLYFWENYIDICFSTIGYAKEPHFLSAITKTQFKKARVELMFQTEHSCCQLENKKSELSKLAS